MKIRFISSLVAIAVLFIAMFMPVWGFLFAVSVIMIIAILEYYSAYKNAGYHIKLLPLMIGAISIIPVWLINIYSVKLHTKMIPPEAIVLVWVIFAISICAGFCVFTNMKFNVVDVAITAFGMLYIILPYTILVMIRAQNQGLYLIWLAFFGAWMTDISAYFSGKFFGKRKIIPLISEKKTVEGFIGGVIGCTLVITIYGLWLQTKDINLALTYYIGLGVLCGIISQIGDWFASSIKRHLKIKDFGHIMPGHGGVLDRFDSVFAVAPVIYTFMLFFL